MGLSCLLFQALQTNWLIRFFYFYFLLSFLVILYDVYFQFNDINIFFSLVCVAVVEILMGKAVIGYSKNQFPSTVLGCPVGILWRKRYIRR